jgi:hypothetical protein
LTRLTRRPAFWVAYAALALLCAVFARQLFPAAFPLVNLEIRLTQSEAAAKAEALGRELRLAPEDARSVARFANDALVQNYVELEGGGREAFARLVAGRAYAPYAWEVRLFKPGQVEEATVRFRPDGTLDGFTHRLPESYVHNPDTRALDATAALELARTRARDVWGVDFGPYRLLEQSQTTLPSGRVDHAFVFERDETLADARIRLRLAVAGDELTGITPYVHVPERFERRFQELRSANDTIASVASIAAGVLYGLGGCVFGTLWLLRRRRLLWRPALAAGAVVAALVAASILSAAPAAWFGFDTARSVGAFWLQQAGAVVFVLLGGTLGYGLAFMAAEGLTRSAFGHHPQLWRVWSRDAGASIEIAGRTIGGYLFVPVELALIVAFYYASNRWLGWWQPSEALTDPDILSAAVPALTPIAMSLQAGFMEECVFRAIPLSLGALVGAHFGRRTLGIAMAVLLQAVVFGAAHANYPGFPAFSRLVELLLPAVLWALIYLRFGLLPTILLHALFDLCLMAMPLFLVAAPGAWTQQGLVIAAALLPLAILVVRRAQVGAWISLPVALYNAAWRPSRFEAAAEVAGRRPAVEAVTPRTAALQRALPWLAVAGGVAWLAFTPFVPDVPVLSLDRAGAQAAAEAALDMRGVRLGPQWRRLPVVKPAGSEQRLWHRFVWQEAGPAVYRALSGQTLAPPLWEVRFARFDGDVAQRAEEWRVTVAGDGQVRQVAHRLPEAAPGARLARAEAEIIARQAVRERFGLDPAQLQLRAADQSARDARSDWTFVYADPAVSVGKDGEARVQIVVAGDEVVSAGHAVFVPEAWERAQVERDERLQGVRLAGGLAGVLAALAALVLAIINWNRGHCDKPAMRALIALVFAVTVVNLGNNWPAIAYGLSTAQPVPSQVAIAGLSALFGGLVVALLGGLLGGVGAWYARWLHPVSLAGRLPAWANGIAVALVAHGLAAAFGALAPRDAPLAADLHLATPAWPMLAALVEPLKLAAASGLVLFVFYLFDRVTAHWTRRVWLAALIVVLVSCASALRDGDELVGALLRGTGGGLVAFALLWRVVRFDPRIVPALLATGMLLDGAQNSALAGTATAWGLFAAGAVVTVAVAWAVTRYIGRALQGASPPRQTASAEPT